MAEDPKFTEPLHPDGTLSAETLALIQKHITEKFTNPCPSCGHRDFSISERLYAPVAMGHGRSLDLGNLYPTVLLVCQTCAHLMPFGARQMGLYQPIEKESDGK